MSKKDLRRIVLCGNRAEAEEWNLPKDKLTAFTVKEVRDGALQGVRIDAYSVTELARDQKGIYEAVCALHCSARGRPR